MNLAFLQRSTPHVEILILVTLGIFLILWGLFALLTWLKNKPWRQMPESSVELRSSDDKGLSDDRNEIHDESVNSHPLFDTPQAHGIVPHRA